MKYLGDLLRISIFVLIMYIPMMFFSIQGNLKLIDTDRAKIVANRLIKARTIVETYLNEGKVLEACQRLDAEFEADTVVAYSLKNQDVECFKKQELLAPYLVHLENKKYEEFKIGSDQGITIYKDESPDITWVIAAQLTLKKGVIERFLESASFRDAIYKDLLIAIYIIFAFIFFGVLVLAGSIQNQYRRQGKDPVWLKIINKAFGWLQLQDLKIIQSANIAMMKKNDDLVKDLDLLSTSLEFSILTEIKTHQKQVPYTFYGTVVKVDINGFSKVIAGGHKNATVVLTTKLEDFGCELLQRYGGLFEKTVGDEIVAVFKNAPTTKDSDLNALAFARDLMREFSEIEFDFSGEKRKFTLKAGIGDSDLTFSKRTPGYGFSGDALTYTTRLLDVVKIKDRNIVCCLEDQAAVFQNLIYSPAQLENFEFKNMNTAKGYQIDKFLDVQTAYEKHPEKLKYFKSDTDIYFLLDQIQIENNLENLQRIFKCLSEIQVRVCSPDLVKHWTASVVSVQNKKENLKHFEFILAQIIMVGSNLIPQEQWNSECKDTILNVPRHIQGRINASIIELLSEKKLADIVIQESESFILSEDQSFRTRGNLLVNQALYRLDDEVLSNVFKMLQSKNNLELSTGIFVCGQIIAHYEAVNPASLRTFRYYKKIITELQKIQKRQAKKTLQISERVTAILNQTLTMC